MKGDRRLIKELDMCRIIKDIKDLQTKNTQPAPAAATANANPFASILKSLNLNNDNKHRLIDIDVDSEDDMHILQKLKRRLSLTVE